MGTILAWIVGLFCIIVGIYGFVKGNASLGVLWLVIGVGVIFVGVAWKKRRK